MEFGGEPSVRGYWAVDFHVLCPFSPAERLILGIEEQPINLTKQCKTEGWKLHTAPPAKAVGLGRCYKCSSQEAWIHGQATYPATKHLPYI